MVVVRAAAGAKEQAHWLLDTLAAAHAKKKLAAGQTVQLGWTTLRLVSSKGELHVHEPDYDDDSPETTRDDVTVSLTVLARQKAVLDQVKAEGQPLDYDDKIVVAGGALHAKRVRMLRSGKAKSADSGWFVGFADEEASDDQLEALWVYQLLMERPALLSVLLLPPDYLVVFDGDEIVSIHDPADKDVWSQNRAGTKKSRP
jgi:hypothetical protein